MIIMTIDDEEIVIAAVEATVVTDIVLELQGEIEIAAVEAEAQVGKGTEIESETANTVGETKTTERTEMGWIETGDETMMMTGGIEKAKIVIAIKIEDDVVVVTNGAAVRNTVTEAIGRIRDETKSHAKNLDPKRKTLAIARKRTTIPYG